MKFVEDTIQKRIERCLNDWIKFKIMEVKEKIQRNDKNISLTILETVHQIRS